MPQQWIQDRIRKPRKPSDSVLKSRAMDNLTHLRIYHMPSSIIKALHALSHLILTKTHARGTIIHSLQMRNPGLEKLSNLPKVTLLVNGQARIWISTVWFRDMVSYLVCCSGEECTGWGWLISHFLGASSDCSQVSVTSSTMIIFLIFFTSIYFWETERETEHKNRKGREIGRHRMGSRLQAMSCQHRAWCGARTHRLQDYDLSRSQTLNWVTQAPLHYDFYILRVEVTF